MFVYNRTGSINFEMKVIFANYKLGKTGKKNKGRMLKTKKTGDICPQPFIILLLPKPTMGQCTCFSVLLQALSFQLLNKLAQILLFAKVHFFLQAILCHLYTSKFHVENAGSFFVGKVHTNVGTQT